MTYRFLWGAYFLQFLDKTLINYANIMGLTTDTNTSAAQFSYLALAFYCSYLVCEIPQGYLMHRFPTAKYLGVQVILWGLVVPLCIYIYETDSHEQNYSYFELCMQEFHSPYDTSGSAWLFRICRCTMSYSDNWNGNKSFIQSVFVLRYPVC